MLTFAAVSSLPVVWVCDGGPTTARSGLFGDDGTFVCVGDGHVGSLEPGGHPKRKAVHGELDPLAMFKGGDGEVWIQSWDSGKLTLESRTSSVPAPWGGPTRTPRAFDGDARCWLEFEESRPSVAILAHDADGDGQPNARLGRRGLTVHHCSESHLVTSDVETASNDGPIGTYEIWRDGASVGSARFAYPPVVVKEGSGLAMLSVSAGKPIVHRFDGQSMKSVPDPTEYDGAYLRGGATQDGFVLSAQWPGRSVVYALDKAGAVTGQVEFPDLEGILFTDLKWSGHELCVGVSQKLGPAKSRVGAACLEADPHQLVAQ